MNISENESLLGFTKLKNLEPKQTETTAEKMKFSMKDFFSKRDQIRSFLRIWSHLLKKFFMENFIFCAVKKGELKTKNTKGRVLKSESFGGSKSKISK